MQHYFKVDESLEHNIKSLDFKFHNQSLKFLTDNGVFSKNSIDYGTRVLLNSYVPKIKDGLHLDLGCGYGVIGITLAKIYELNFEMVDVNERSLSLAKQNSSLNGVEHKVKIFESNCYENIGQKYNSILTNPPIRAGKQVVHTILSEAYNYLENDGELWVVIQKKQGAPSAKKLMLDTFGNCEVVSKDKGYYILKSIK